jgi:hypothetical protein
MSKYYLCAEDTSDRALHKITPLRSIRFSRAMRQARGEPKTRGACTYFIAQLDAEGNPDMATACSLAVTRKPAPVGSPENQAHQRTTLRRQKPSARSGKASVDWDREIVSWLEGV